MIFYFVQFNQFQKFQLIIGMQACKGRADYRCLPMTPRLVIETSSFFGATKFSLQQHLILRQLKNAATRQHLMAAAASGLDCDCCVTRSRPDEKKNQNITELLWDRIALTQMKNLNITELLRDTKLQLKTFSCALLNQHIAHLFFRPDNL